MTDIDWEKKYGIGNECKLYTNYDIRSLTWVKYHVLELFESNQNLISNINDQQSIRFSPWKTFQSYIGIYRFFLFAYFSVTIVYVCSLLYYYKSISIGGGAYLEHPLIYCGYKKVLIRAIQLSKSYI